VAAAGSARILLVADNPEVQALGREILSSAGYLVTTASSGDEGLAIFTQEPAAFDLLFSDIVMPGGRNGIVLAEDIRRLRPELPVLLTTGYNEDLLAEGPARPSLASLANPTVAPNCSIASARRWRNCLHPCEGPRPISDPQRLELLCLCLAKLRH